MRGFSIIAAFVLTLVMTAASSRAQAACSSPSGNEGDVNYSSTQHIMVYCNGTSWISMGATVSGVTFGSLTTGDFCTATSGTAISCTTATVSLSSQVSGTLQAAQFPALTGDVTTSAGSLATTIGANKVTMGDIAQIAGLSIIGNSSNSTANVAAITGTANQTLIVNSGGTGLAFGALNLASSAAVTGSLSVANGGTGATAFTQGSVVFAGASGVYTQNNAQFFWDNSGNRLGIGTSIPSVPLQVSAATGGVTISVGPYAGNGGGQVTFAGASSGTITNSSIASSNTGGLEIAALQGATIGTAAGVNPSGGAMLQVGGNAAIGASYTGNSTGAPSNGLIVQGSVGIASSSPLVSLDLSQETDAIALPAGTNGTRPTGVNGMIRYNSSVPGVEAYVSGTWSSLLTTAGAVTSFSGDGTFATNSSSTGAVTLTIGSAAAKSLWGNASASIASPAYQTSPVVSGSMTANTFVSTVASGTAPFTVSSNTLVSNLNAALLNGATFASPGAIGGGTAGSGTFSSVTDTALSTPGVVLNSGAGLLSSASTLPIANGGTNAASATAALSNLLANPSSGTYTINCTSSSSCTYAASSGSTSLSSLTTATATDSFDNTTEAQTWTWNTLGAQTAMTMSSSATATTGIILNVSTASTSGAYAIKAQATGVTGANYALYGSAASPAGWGVYATNSTTAGNIASGAGSALFASETGASNTATAIFGSNMPGTNTGVNYGGYFTDNSTGGGYGIYATETGGTGTNYGVYGVSASSAGYGGYFTNSSSGVGLFASSASGYAAIFNGGNVGVGTTTPTYDLSLGGAAAREIWMERTPSASAAAGNNLTVQSGGASSGGTNLNGGNLVLSSGISTGTGSSQIQFQTAPNAATGTADSAPATAMKIQQVYTPGVATNTQVAIGTTAFGGTINTVGGANNTSVMIFNQNTYNGGSAVAGFEAVNSGGSYAAFGESSNAYSATTLSGIISANSGFMVNGAVGGIAISATYSTGTIRFATGGTAAANERMRIDQNGVVGIGTTTMSSSNLLEVNGAAAIGYVNTAAPSNGMIVAGSVGIGTSSPTDSLDLSQRTDAISLPSGATTARPATGVNGMIRYNSATPGVEAYISGAWATLVSGSGLTWPLAGPADSVSAPDYAWSGDTNTGMYHVSSGTLGLAAAGTQALTATNATVTIPMATTSTATTTGALVVTGGLGVGNTAHMSAVYMSGLHNSGAGSTAYVPISTSLPYPASGMSTGIFIDQQNTTALNAVGTYFIPKVLNSSSNAQFGYVGAISNSGAGVYAPNIVFGQSIGTSSYSERMRIDQNGVVGIGTTTMSSSNLLEVNGAVSVGYPNTAAPSTGMIVAGSAGIGTTSPASALQLGSGVIETPVGSAGAPPYTFSTDTNTGIYDVSTGTLGVAANGVQGMTISSTVVTVPLMTASTTTGSGALVVTGGMGVGGTLYSNKVAVTGAGIIVSGNANDAYISSGTSSVGPATGSGATFVALSNSLAGNADSSVIEFTTKNASSNSQTAYIAGFSNAGAGVYTPTIVFGQQTGATAYNERMRIDQNGVVGIGTTTMSSSNALEVNGAAAIGYTNTAAPTNGLLVNGYVGIGTSSPTDSLDLSQRTDAISLPAGASTARPASGVNGMIRYNTNTPGVEAYVNNAWATVSTGAGGAALSALTTATATNTIDNTTQAQTWTWNTLAGQTAMTMSSSATGTTGIILNVSTASTSGAYAIKAQATGATGANYAIYGSAASATGYGVYGTNSTVTGTASTGAGAAVYASQTGTSNTAAAVYGANAPGTNAGVNYGGYFTDSSTGGGYGIYGAETAASGTNYGVYGTSASSAGYGGYFTNTSSGTGLYVNSTSGYAAIFNTGRVGIGSTTPTGILTVSNGTPPGTSVPTGNTAVFSSGTSNGKIYFTQGNMTAYFAVNNASSGAAEFSTYDYGGSTGLPLFMNANGGNVLVGNYTPLPSSQLAVSGNMSVGTSYIGNAAPTNGLIVQGSVGVGSTVPRTSLDLSQETDAVILPIGASTARPSTGVNGMIRYNTNTPGVEAYVNNAWATVATGTISTALSGLTAATGTNTFDNTTNAQTWTWNTLAGQTAMTMSSTGTTTTGIILNVSTASTSGAYAIKAQATGTSGANYAVYGSIASATGYAHYGTNSATGGTASTGAGSAIYGSETGNSNTAAAVYGINAPATNAAVNYGGYFSDSSTTAGAAGVYGVSTNATATATYGVYGANTGSSNTGAGVYGTNVTTGVNYGVEGSNASATAASAGVYGVTSGAAATYGVEGSNTGATANGIGVYGIVSGNVANFGVEGSNPSTAAGAAGVYGVESAASGANYGVYGTSASSTGYGGYFTNSSSGPALYASSTSGYALITGAGNVGIGTTAPGSPLQVVAGAAPVAPSLTTRNGTATFTSGGGYPELAIGEYPGSPYGLWVQAQRTSDSTTYPIILNPLGGSIGIGTAAPAQALEVNGTTKIDTGLIVPLIYPAADSTSAIQVDKADGSTNIVTIDTTNSRIGIGTTAPGSILQIGSPYPSDTIGSVPVVRVLGNVQSTTSQTMLRLNRPLSSGNYYSGGVDFNVYAYGAAGSPYNPTTQMDIALKASASQTETSNVTVMSLRDNGNVGIGTGAPGATLDVYGGIDIKELNAISYPTGDSTLGASIAIGKSALNTETAAGSAAYDNTAVGYQAIGAGTMTTAAVQNAAVGYGALANITSGSNNTAIGYAAGTEITSGGANTAIGEGVMSDGSFTGSNNTGVGAGALFLMTGTAGGNTAVGTLAGYALQGANYSTAIGESTMGSNSSSYGTAVGALAYSYGSGSYNDAFGYEALNSVSGGSALSGSYNVAIGDQSLFALQGTAAGNVAHGYQAGYSVTTGSNNTILGYQVANATLTTGSNNILIGTDSTTTSIGTNTANWMNIGNAIYGYNLYNSTNSSGVPQIGIGKSLTSVTAGAVLDLSSNTASTNSSMILPIGSSNVRPSTGVNGMIRYNNFTNAVEAYANNAWTSLGSGGGGSLSSLTAATATNTIDSTTQAQTWTWNTLAGQTAMTMSSTATGATGIILDVSTASTSGATAIKGIATGASGTNYAVYGTSASSAGYGGYFTNTSSGPALYASSTSGYAAIFNVGNVGIGTTGPDAAFHVVGADSNATSYSVFNARGATVAVYPNGQIDATSSTATASQSTVGALDFLTFSPSASSSTSVYGRYIEAVMPSTATNGTSGSLQGLFINAIDQANVTLTGGLYGLDLQAENISTTTLPTAYGSFALVGNNKLSSGTNQASTITASYGNAVQTLNASSAATIGSQYGFYSSMGSMTGTITNGYGVYVTGEGTGGTWTNTPYDFYGADSGAYNYFGGNVGIGSTAPTSLLQTYENAVKTANYTSILIDAFDTSSTASINKIGLDVESTGAWSGTSDVNTGLVVNVSGGTTNYAATFSGGNVGIGTTTPAYPLQIGTSSSNGNGAYLAAAGVWVNASDRRIKENIEPIPYGLDAVMKLKPVVYDMKDSHEKQIGFVAQDVLDVIPEVVGVPKNPATEHYGLSYGNMVAVTVKAIQEMKADNDNLKKQINLLQSKIDKSSGKAPNSGATAPTAIASSPTVSDVAAMEPALRWIGGGMLAIIALMGGLVIHTNREMRKLRKKLKKKG